MLQVVYDFGKDYIGHNFYKPCRPAKHSNGIITDGN